MKLTAHIPRVKPVSPFELMLAAVLAGVGVLLLFTAVRPEGEQVEHFGESLVRALAAQAVEPVLEQDLITLGVLTNRLVALPEVNGASVHDMDNASLALSGDVRRGQVFSAQVVDNGQSAAVVRIFVDAKAFGTSTPWGLVMAALVWTVLAPLAVLATGRIAIPLPAPGIRRQTSSAGEADPLAALPEPEPLPCHLLTINLFNQLALAGETRQEALAVARSRAEQIASLYLGVVRDLPGTGLLLEFPANGSDDRPFHVLCAAFVTSRLLAACDSGGRYRLAVHTCLLEGEETLSLEDEIVKDSAVLSALAGDNRIALSGRFLATVPYAQRVEGTTMTHPLLDELDSCDGAFLATALAEPHGALMEAQLADLLDGYEDGSTARESTF
ncbi:MAG: hypothetical protein AAGE43_05605 [Pseudomonadota bacterium]